MSGVFPNSGVLPDSAANSIADPDLADGCTALYHSSTRCTPRFDPASANAVISEIINLVNCAGLDYDCNKLTNLCEAVKAIATKPGTAFTFDTAGNHTVTVPSDASYAEIELVGGGGGGGGASPNGSGSGGNGGDFVRSITPVTPTSVLTLTVGAGGAAGTPALDAGAGGASTMLGFIAMGGNGGASAGSGVIESFSPVAVGSVGQTISPGGVAEPGYLIAGQAIGGRGGNAGDGAQGGLGSRDGGTNGNQGFGPGAGGGGGANTNPPNGFPNGASGRPGRVRVIFR